MTTFSNYFIEGNADASVLTKNNGFDQISFSNSSDEGKIYIDAEVIVNSIIGDKQNSQLTIDFDNYGKTLTITGNCIPFNVKGTSGSLINKSTQPLTITFERQEHTLETGDVFNLSDYIENHDSQLLGNNDTDVLV